MTTKTKKKFRRIIVLTLGMIIVFFTVKTLSIGIDLVLISEQNYSVEGWRSTEEGAVAANNIYASNAEYRDAIYNSSDAYTAWISTAPKIAQIIIGFGLIILSVFSIMIWYAYINSLRKRIKQLLSKKQKNKLVY